MKNWKKVLLIAVAALTSVSFAACGDDEEEEVKGTVETTFVGKLGVSMADFSMDNVEGTVTYNNEDKTCKIVLKEVTFSKKMPMTMDLVIDGATYSNGTISGSNIETQAIMNGTTMSAGFTIENLQGSLKDGKVKISAAGKYGRGADSKQDLTVTYEGSKK